MVENRDFLTMAAKGKEICLREREIIIKLWKKGKSYREIGKTINRAHSSVQRVINNFQSSGILLSKPRSGRPSKLSIRESRSLIGFVKKNPKITASQIVNNIEKQFQKKICADTARKILKRAGYKGRVARRKPFISVINRQKRLKYAYDHINKPLDFWQRVIFSDESKYCIFGIKGRKIVWRKAGTALNKENLLPTVKHGGGGAMVWGCIAGTGVGQLDFVESTMDKYGYLDILKRNLNQSAEKLGLNHEYYFMHDNDPKHTSHIVKLWLLYNVPKQLHSPPQSLGLNPIEHLWDLLEKRIRQRTITSKQMLKTALKEEWEKITPEETSNLVNSMKNRLKEVIKRRGYPTSY